MVTYYNLTNYTGTSGVMDMFRTTSKLTSGYFGLMIIILVFIIPSYVMIKNGKDPNITLHYASLFAMILSILFYVSQVISYSIIIYIFAMIYTTTLIVKWYNK